MIIIYWKIRFQIYNDKRYRIYIGQTHLNLKVKYLKRNLRKKQIYAWKQYSQSKVSNYLNHCYVYEMLVREIHCCFPRIEPTRFQISFGYGTRVLKHGASMSPADLVCEVGKEGRKQNENNDQIVWSISFGIKNKRFPIN